MIFHDRYGWEINGLRFSQRPKAMRFICHAAILPVTVPQAFRLLDRARAEGYVFVNLTNDLFAKILD